MDATVRLNKVKSPEGICLFHRAFTVSPRFFRRCLVSMTFTVFGRFSRMVFANASSVGRRGKLLLNTSETVRCASGSLSGRVTTPVSVIQAPRMASAGTRVLPRLALTSCSRVFRLAARSLRHQRSVLAVGREHAVEARQVDPGLWDQRGQPGDEVQRLEDHMGRAVPKALATLAGQAFAVRRLQLVADVAVRGERQALLRDCRTADGRS